ncbi:MAG TPA: alpha/beta hydrolase [Acidocella sp.]|nr:alpha/beta hydrolase [Acidocella sp.]HQU05022.1 alpha/beta hydrolase [Acidocella sp.]
MLTQAQRDRAYNNAAAVANSAQLVKDRNEKSALYRAAHTGHLDLPYGTAERAKWDLYPSKSPAAPCLVFIHGGYWQMNRREDFAIFAEGLAAHGWSVAMPGYSLGPDASMTEIVAEMRASLDWLAANGAAHGIAGKIIISGWSAGAQLAALVLDHPSVVAGLAISGVYELGPLRDTYLNAKLHLTEDEIAAFSPLRLPAVHKPMTIAYGSLELPALVIDSRDLHAVRAAAHSPGALIPVAGADHFTILQALQAADGELVRAALALAG